MLLPEGVRIGERATCPLGESGWSLIRIAMRATCPTLGSPDEVAPDSEARHMSSRGGVPIGRSENLSNPCACRANNLTLLSNIMSIEQYKKSIS